VAAPHALDRHVALVGFMGAGKSTLGPQLAERIGRPFLSVDDLVERRVGQSIPELFAEGGEAAFREVEEETALELLGGFRPAVVELGGGALGSPATRAALSESAFVLQLDVTSDEAWSRVKGSDRPLARDPDRFLALHAERAASYRTVADATPDDLESATLAVAGIHFGSHGDVIGEAVVADERVAALHDVPATNLVPSGEEAKTLREAERLWRSLGLERGSTLVAVGGGTTLDLAGFVAATFLRGIAWVPVPTTLVGQVDAAIGGKTAIDLPEGKNLVGAFHWPVRTVIDTSFLETLPEPERENGLAEVVKTGLLAADPLWELEPAEQVRRCAAFKAAVCLRDPHDRGERAQLNLGHTFGHALEAASGYSLPHGKAVALGLVAALRLSGLEDERAEVERLLDTSPVAVDRDAAWAALERDKKSVAGTVRFVLLDAPGRPRIGVELSARDARAALDSLIVT
jgi:shikimate kinase/3-dehydroquinate synthase